MTLPLTAHNGFRLIGREPYARKDGTPSEILTWQRPCATCGALFTAKTSRGAEAEPQRHHELERVNCPAHRGSVTARAQATRQEWGKRMAEARARKRGAQ